MENGVNRTKTQAASPDTKILSDLIAFFLIRLKSYQGPLEIKRTYKSHNI